ncbi:P-loop containing nucleoside triphosphate hydrolase protein [Chaetomidium leptoderma]|uniref:P-loop containing nucleoside triphosphate hydrolase protein n=1 Tax=Chaetomidium leptoderma TaxID=669021 RepID=A0AAN6ZS89_9PEZI|nr:P-loop containing nucleoside triphosphate hydrolase protein [Chaetomidium leptoderma]
MSPPVLPPTTALHLRGGRAQQGNQLRQEGEPTGWDAVFAPTIFAGVVGGNAARAFDFTVESAVRSGTVAPPTTPAGPIPGAGGLYGQAYVVGQGNLHFETTPRMESWLGRLQALSLGDEEDAGLGSAQDGSAVGEGTALNDESPRVGDKRSAPTDDDDEARDLDQPAAKRSRVGAVLQRTLSRMGRGRADSASRAVGGNMTTTPAAFPPSAFLFSPAGAASPAPRAFSPFGFLSRVGSGTAATAATAAAAPSMVASRTIKVCLVGDVAAGKTALFNRLSNNPFVPTSTSLVPDLKSVAVRAEDGSFVNVELWDFPGIVAGDRAGPLLSTFFHAAIICFSLEDKKNLASIAEMWKPKLDLSLHDQHVFVLGLKRDLRPSYPTLGLSFLPTTEPVTFEMVRPLKTETHAYHNRAELTHHARLQGRQAAIAIRASGYGECSALTTDNVQAAWEGIVNHVVATLEEHEQQTINNGRRRVRAKSAVTGFLIRCGMGRFGKGGRK